MKLRNINTIISREYLTRVKKKSFLLTTFLVPILFAAMCILPSVIMFMAEDTGKQAGSSVDGILQARIPEWVAISALNKC